MADYVVRLTGKDDLSNTIKQVKNSLDDVGKSTSKIDKIDEKFNKIINSSAPLKRQLRDLQNIMAKMNIDGLSNTDQFTKIAEKAGEIKDAMNDASDAVKRFADDNFKLTAMADGLQMIAGAGTIATGAMGLLGTENEKVQQAILKVQSALAILNGVQAIANKLNKDSALMQRIKQIRLAASTAATTGETAALTANTVATSANTAGIIANTAATRAWNVAKAVAKALLGDWTGLILVGVAGMAAYAIATSTATDEQEKQNDALKDGAKAQDTYTSTMTNTYAQLLTKYQQMRIEWNKLSNDQQRNQWIKQNANALNELGLEVSNVATAEAAFNGNTNSVVDSFIARAKAAARLTQLTEEYRKQMELIDQLGKVQTDIQTDAARTGRSKYKVGDKVTDQNDKNTNYAELRGNDWYYTQKGIDRINGAISSTNPIIKDLNNKLDESNKRVERITAEIAKDAKTPSLKNTPQKTNTPKGSTTPEPLKGSLGAMEKELQKLQSGLKNGFIPESEIEKTKTKINQLTADIEKKKIELGFAEPKKEEIKKIAEGSIASIQSEIKTLDERLQNEKITIGTRLEIEEKKNELQNQIDTITKGEVTIKAEVAPSFISKGSTDDLRQSYENASSIINRIQGDLQKGIIDDGKAKEQIAAVNKQLTDLGLKPIQIEFETNISKVIGNVQSAFDGLKAIDGVVNSMERMQSAFSEGANEWEKFISVVEIASSVLSAVQTIMTTVNAVGELLNITKAGETIATTTATAATAEKAVADSASVAPAVAATTALKAQEAAYLDMAAAAIFAAHSSIPFAGVGIASGQITAMMGAMAAQTAASKALAAFKDGGIVGGSMSEHPILAHKGEIILNERQQRNLFDAINDGNLGGSNTIVGGEVKIKGADLYVALKNYNKIHGLK